MKIDESTTTQNETAKPSAVRPVPRPASALASPGPISSLASTRDERSHAAPLIARLFHQRTSRAIVRVLTLLACDYVGIGAALIGWLSLKAWLKGDFQWSLVSSQVDSYITFAYFVSVLMFARHDLYRERASRPGMGKISTALFQTTIVALIFALANGGRFNSYSVFFGTLICAILTVTAMRAVHDQATTLMTRYAGVSRRALVVGTGAHARSVADAIGNSPRWPIEIVGGVTAPEDMRSAVLQGGIDEVVLADPDLPQDKVIELSEQCHRKGIAVHVAPTTMEILLQRAEFLPGMAVPLFTLNPPVFDGIDFAVKRLFDLVGAALLLALLSPVLVISALSIKLTSRGPLLYRSRRPGIGERPFDCLKFRTMSIDADARMEDLERFNEASGALFKIRKDPRITGVGRLLRRFSIDELPQLWNVLRGEMSLVGPRPLPQRDFDLLEDWHKQRYRVLPGITGLWQVSGRADLDFDDLVRLDFVYLERWSVGLDLLILLKTFPAVLARRGAY